MCQGFLVRVCLKQDSYHQCVLEWGNDKSIRTRTPTHLCLPLTNSELGTLEIFDTVTFLILCSVSFAQVMDVSVLKFLYLRMSYYCCIPFRCIDSELPLFQESFVSLYPWVSFLLSIFFNPTLQFCLCCLHFSVSLCFHLCASVLHTSWYFSDLCSLWLIQQRWFFYSNVVLIWFHLLSSSYFSFPLFCIVFMLCFIACFCYSEVSFKLFSLVHVVYSFDLYRLCMRSFCVFVLSKVILLGCVWEFKFLLILIIHLDT